MSTLCRASDNLLGLRWIKRKESHKWPVQSQSQASHVGKLTIANRQHIVNKPYHPRIIPYFWRTWGDKSLFLIMSTQNLSSNYVLLKCFYITIILLKSSFPFSLTPIIPFFICLSHIWKRPYRFYHSVCGSFNLKCSMRF